MMRSCPIVMGRAADGQDVTLDLANPHHVLITGATRSGKSAQLYAMLAQLRGRPVHVAGIDPSGIVFAALGDALGGSDWRVMTTRDPGRCVSVLDSIVQEMDRRISGLLERRIDKISNFTDSCPIVVVVLEEYPGLLSALSAIDVSTGARGADRAEVRLRAAVQRLALEGAKVGLRLVLLAQRADASLLTGVLRSQLTARFCMRQDADGLRMLLEDVTPEDVAAMTSFAPGVGYAEVAGVLPLTKYRADWMPYERLVSLYR